MGNNAYAYGEWLKRELFLCDRRGTNSELARWAAHICWWFSFAFKNCANVAEKKCNTER